MQTTIILIGKEAKIYAMMKVLDSLGAWDITYGKLTLDFDGVGKISNVKIEKNYRELSTIDTKIPSGV